MRRVIDILVNFINVFLVFVFFGFLDPEKKLSFASFKFKQKNTSIGHLFKLLNGSFFRENSEVLVINEYL